MIRGALAGCCVAPMLLAGCAGPLPCYAWSGGANAMALMARRDAAIRTFSATCRLLLDSSAGKIELRGVIVAHPPDRLRIRAWKFSQAVFDVTMNPDGLYVFAKEQHDAASAELSRVTHRELADAATLLPGFSAKAAWRIGDVGRGSFTRIRAVDQQKGVMACEVDKGTLTTRRCDFRATGGSVQQSLAFADYRIIGGVPWPMRVSGSGSGGSFLIVFDDVHLNEDLPANVFAPPRRAVKQP
jgi:hypothetical protein